jgi:hypothetical protein
VKCEAMKNLAFWKPVIFGATATPIFLFVTFVAAGAGHGSYLPMFIFYPISLLLLMLGITTDGIEDAFLQMIVGNGITILAIGVAIIQFPFYGFIISYSRAKTEPTWFTVWEIIAWIHIGISLITLPFAFIATIL